jgi:hypothetical protein
MNIQPQATSAIPEFWSTPGNPFVLDGDKWTSHKGKLELGDPVANMPEDVNWANWGRAVIANDGSDSSYLNTALNVTSFSKKPGDMYGEVIEVAADPSNQAAVGGVTGLYIEMDTPVPERLVNPGKIVEMSAMQLWSETGAPIQRLHGIDIQKLGATNGDEVVGLDVQSLYNTSNPSNIWAIRTAQGKVELGDKLIVHGNVDASSITVNGQPFVGAIGPMGPQGPVGPQGPTGPAGPAGGPAGTQGASLFSMSTNLSDLPPSTLFFNILTGVRFATENWSTMAMVASACTIDTLVVKTDSAPGAASETVMIRTGSTPALSDSALSCTLAGSSQTCTSFETASVNAGDFIGVQVSVANATLPSQHHVWIAMTCK